MKAKDLEPFVRSIPNFPKPGIMFRDITPLLQDARAWSATIELMSQAIETLKPTKLVAIESRGFIFASAVSAKLGLGLALVRKRGKLPYKVHRQTYALEYGTDELEMHIDSLDANDRVVIVDDVLATGGTAEAAMLLCQKMGAKVLAVHVLVELLALRGSARFKDTSVSAIFNF